MHRNPWMVAGALVVMSWPASRVRAQESGAELSGPRPQGNAQRVPSPRAAPARPAATPAGVRAPAPDTADLPPVPTPPSEPAEPPTGYEASSPAPPGRYPRLPGATGFLPSIDLPLHMSTRLRVLEANFTTLAAHGNNSTVDGVLSIVTGGLALTLGLVAANEQLSIYFYLLGSASILRGATGLLIAPDPTQLTIAFSNMPTRNVAEAQARLDYGEREFESLASQSRILRFIDASINIAAGVAIVPLYLGPNGFKVDEFGAFVIIGAAISLISGTVSMLTRSDAERRWSAYENLVDRLDSAPSASVRWHLTPMVSSQSAGVMLTAEM